MKGVGGGLKGRLNHAKEKACDVSVWVGRPPTASSPNCLTIWMYRRNGR